MLRSSPLCVAAATAVLLAGCGGSSSGNASSPAPQTGAGVSRSAFIARADALCQGTHRSQTQLEAQAKGLTIAKLPPILRKQATYAADLVTRLRALEVPAGDQVPVGRFIAAVKLLGVLSTAAANSIQAGHLRAVEGLKVKLNIARQQETELGQGYGFKVCASGRSF